MSICRSHTDSHSAVRKMGDGVNNLNEVATFALPLVTYPSTKNTKIAYATFNGISSICVLKNSAC